MKSTFTMYLLLYLICWNFKRSGSIASLSFVTTLIYIYYTYICFFKFIIELLWKTVRRNGYQFSTKELLGPYLFRGTLFLSDTAFYSNGSLSLSLSRSRSLSLSLSLALSLSLSLSLSLFLLYLCFSWLNRSYQFLYKYILHFSYWFSRMSQSKFHEAEWELVSLCK